MEKRNETSRIKRKEDGRQQVYKELILGYIHSYTRQLASLPSDLFRYQVETLRNTIIALDKAQSDNRRNEGQCIPPVHIWDSYDQNDSPRFSPDSSKQDKCSIGVSQNNLEESFFVRNEVTFGENVNTERRKSKQKQAKQKPVVFLENDANGDTSFKY